MKRILFCLLFILFFTACGRDREMDNYPEGPAAPDTMPGLAPDPVAATVTEDTDALIKFISNLQPGLPSPIPPKKAQLDWLIHGAGGEDVAGRTNAAGELAPLHASVTGQFSYQFTCENGIIAGRVEGDNGEIRIFALRENGTFALIRYEDGTFFRGATGDTVAEANEAAAYQLAIQFVVHFATMTRVAHTHTFPHPLSVLSTEDFPIYEGSDRIITFGYDGQDIGGMMRAMEFEGTVKLVSNLQPNLPSPIPPKKAQLDWLIHGAGGEDIAGRTNETGDLAPLHASVTGQFSYQFTCEDGIISGRVEGENGEIRIFALRENGTFALIRYEDGTFFRGATGDTLAEGNEAAAYKLAVQFTVYFATMTRVAHTHTFPHPLSVLSTEDFPIYEGSDRIITFGYDGQDTGGMMRAMEFEGIVKFVSHLQPNLPSPIPPKKAQLDWLIHGAGGEDIAGRTNAEGELAPLHASVTGQFSYQFTCENNTVAGRVEGDNGEIRIFALRENGTFAHIRYENGTFYRGATGDTVAEEGEAAAYKLAIQFVVHYATMTRVAHTHTFPHPLSVLSTEDFPIYEGSEIKITFGYDGQDTGGMMRAMSLPN